MGNVKSLKRLGFLSDALDGLLTDERRVIFYPAETVMPEHSYWLHSIAQRQAPKSCAAESDITRL